MKYTLETLQVNSEDKEQISQENFALLSSTLILSQKFNTKKLEIAKFKSLFAME